ncbi:hypothetical protein AQJ23_03400 [Streptomyces antibioticus]|nr:RICIN domain-containing protein [Streptomyces antibioticus]KUN29803.1 hypothetical protein AQJ23_03400 [Streptomyces antibioticus]
MTTPPDEPAGEAPAARPGATGEAHAAPAPSPALPSPLPQRRRGPSAIAEASAGVSRPNATADGPATPPESSEPDTAAPMSEAAAEFAALTAAEPAPAPAVSRSGFGAGTPGGFGASGDSGTSGGVGTSAGVGTSGDFAGRTQSAPSATAHPARPRKPLLAGAALVGAVLIAVPFLLTDGDDGDRPADRAASTGAPLPGDHWTGGETGSYGTAAPPSGSPSAQASRGPATDRASDRPKSDDTTPTPDGKATGTATHAAPAASATGGSTATGIRIRGQASGRCLDVTDGSTAERTPLQIWDCSGAARQRWRLASDGTVRALGMCMDVDGGSRDDGATIQLATCNGTGAQRFRLNAAHDLVNVQADKCVDVKDQLTANGSRIQLWTCTGSDNQKWSTA